MLKYLELLGQSGLPTALFLIGFGLNTYKVKNLVNYETMILGSISLILFPIIAFLSSKFVFNLNFNQTRAVTLMAALPNAVNTFIFAKRYSFYVSESAGLILFNLLGSIFTISLVMYFMK